MNTRNPSTVTGAGRAYRLEGALIRREFSRSAAMQEILLRYTQALLTQMSQTAVCNRHHTIEEQLCRWLLMRLDRLPGVALPVTQELIATILGVRRESISQAAGKLMGAGIIGYKRGAVTVLDRPSLERRSCECYSLIRGELERLLPLP